MVNRERDDNVYYARLAEQGERYEDMIRYMKEVAAVSTTHIHLHQRQPAKTDPRGDTIELDAAMPWGQSLPLSISPTRLLSCRWKTDFESQGGVAWFLLVPPTWSLFAEERKSY